MVAKHTENNVKKFLSNKLLLVAALAVFVYTLTVFIQSSNRHVIRWEPVNISSSHFELYAAFDPLIGLAYIFYAFMHSSKKHVIPWKPVNISSPQFESHAAFDPLTGDCYFVRSSPKFEGWHILVSHQTSNGWSVPEPPPFAGDGLEADPFFTSDGGSIYFISNRSTDGIKRKDLDIWRVDRRPDNSWNEPIRLPAPINSDSTEWFPRPAPDGWLYFGSKRLGGFGGNDIWRAGLSEDGKWIVENLGPQINTSGDEYEPLPSPDGSRMIIMTSDGLYESRRAE